MGISFKNASLEELEIIVQEGQRANDFFINNLFWNNTLLPTLKEEVNIANKDGFWNPSKSYDLHQIALVNAYNSGKIAGLSIVQKIVQRLVGEKDEAQKEIDLRRKKEEQKK